MAVGESVSMSGLLDLVGLGAPSIQTPDDLLLVLRVAPGQDGVVLQDLLDQRFADGDLLRTIWVLGSVEVHMDLDVCSIHVADVEVLDDELHGDRV